MKPTLTPLNIHASRASSSPEPDEGAFGYGTQYSSPTTYATDASSPRYTQATSSGTTAAGTSSWEAQWPYSNFSPGRKDSEASTSTAIAATHAHCRSNSSSSPCSPRKSPTVNRFTHCGRHTDQFLFGGLSITGMVKNAFGWKEGRGGNGSSGNAGQ